MSSKTPYQTFQTDWTQAVQYANQNHISKSAWYPVYQQDSGRLINYGYGMSQGERINAIRSAAGMPPTPVPTDNPSPTNILGNIFHNAQDLFSGLNPVSMGKNLFDSVTNAVEHPYSQIIKPMIDLQEITGIAVPWTLARYFGGDKNAFADPMHDFSQSVLGQHSLVAMALPGAWDAAEMFTGKQGFKYLADNPLYTILDAVPVGKIPMGLLGRTEIGAAMAEHLGVTTEELRKMTPGQLAMRRLSIAQKIPMPVKKALASRTATMVTETGKKVKAVPRAVGGKADGPHAGMVQLTAADSVRMLAAQLGAGKDAQEIIRELGVLNNTGEQMFERKMKDYNDTWDKLSVADKKPVMSYLTANYHVDDLHTDANIINGNSEFTKEFTPDQLNAVKATLDMARDYQDMLINDGVLARIKTRLPNADDPEHPIETTELYLAADDSRAAPIIAAKDQRDAAQAELTAASTEYTALGQNTGVMTAIMFEGLKGFSRLTQNLYDAIKASLPQLASDPRAEQLRGILPSDQKFDRVNRAQAQTMGDFLGIDPKQRDLVNRGRDQVEPFSGKQNTWSPAEQEAYNQADRQLRTTHDLTPGTNAFRAQVRKDAKQRLQVLGQLRTVSQHGVINSRTLQILSDLFRPGGYVEQMMTAFHDERWQDFNALTKLIDDKLNLQSFKSKDASPVWDTWRQQMKQIRQYAVMRDKATKRMQELWDGTSHITGKLVSKTKRAQSIKQLTKNLHNANDRFMEESVKHPPAMWDNYLALEYNHQVMERDAGRERAEENIAKLRERGWSEEGLTKLRQDPNVLPEMGELEAVATEANDGLTGADVVEATAIKDEVRDSITRMRSMGFEPLYLPTLHSTEAEKDWAAMSISADHIKKQQSAFEKTQTFNSGTIYDFQTGYNKAVSEYYQNYLEQWFQTEVMPKFLMPRSDLVRMINTYFEKEMLDKVSGPNRSMDEKKFHQMILDRWGLKAYNPDSIFSVTAPSMVGKDMFISKEVAQALDKRWHGDDMPGKVFDKSTGLFRSAILHWSPRFTMHVVVGGAAMLVGASDPVKLAMNIGDAWRFSKTGQLPDRVMASLTTKPDDAYLVSQVRRAASAQEGTTAESILEHEMGYRASQLATKEGVDKTWGKETVHHIQRALTYWPRMNMRLTRFTYNLYHSLAFFEGFDKASKNRYYMHEVYNEQTHQFEYERRDMTGDQLFHEATKHASHAMGDVLAMTPIERNVLTRALPFWSWTRHVMSYVARFPVDHPYRAMLFSQLARVGLADQNPNLPARSQLLFFLGSPDNYGNITAIDMRYANPLRDTANYLTLSGWYSGLNPLLTMLPNAIDPQATFGGNVLYPNITYDSIYGTNDATQPGSAQALSVLEQYVPQVQGIDEALNLSGQYSYLKNDNLSAFTTKVLSAFGADFVMPQHLNIRQISATNEIDRYNQAKKAAAAAWQSGDFSSLAGYGEVPDPRYGTNPVVNIPVSNLQAIWNQEAATLQAAGATQQGATPANAYPQLKNPTL